MKRDASRLRGAARRLWAPWLTLSGLITTALTPLLFAPILSWLIWGAWWVVQLATLLVLRSRVLRAHGERRQLLRDAFNAGLWFVVLAPAAPPVVFVMAILLPEWGALLTLCIPMFLGGLLLWAAGRVAAANAYSAEPSRALAWTVLSAKLLAGAALVTLGPVTALAPLLFGEPVTDGAWALQIASVFLVLSAPGLVTLFGVARADLKQFGHLATRFFRRLLPAATFFLLAAVAGSSLPHELDPRAGTQEFADWFMASFWYVFTLAAIHYFALYEWGYWGGVQRAQQLRQAAIDAGEEVAPTPTPKPKRISAWWFAWRLARSVADAAIVMSLAVVVMAALDNIYQPVGPTLAAGLLASIGAIALLVPAYRRRLGHESAERRAALQGGLMGVYLFLAGLALTAAALLHLTFRLRHEELFVWLLSIGLSGAGGLLFTLGRITGTAKDPSHPLRALRGAAATMRLLVLTTAFSIVALPLLLGSARGSFPGALEMKHYYGLMAILSLLAGIPLLQVMRRSADLAWNVVRRAALPLSLGLFLLLVPAIPWGLGALLFSGAALFEWGHWSAAARKAATRKTTSEDPEPEGNPAATG